MRFNKNYFSCTLCSRSELVLILVERSIDYWSPVRNWLKCCLRGLERYRDVQRYQSTPTTFLPQNNFPRTLWWTQLDPVKSGLTYHESSITCQELTKPRVCEREPESHCSYIISRKARVWQRFFLFNPFTPSPKIKKNADKWNPADCVLTYNGLLITCQKLIGTAPYEKQKMVGQVQKYQSIAAPFLPKRFSRALCRQIESFWLGIRLQ